jgi:polysaccharide export outer membrane protein
MKENLWSIGLCGLLFALPLNASASNYSPGNRGNENLLAPIEPISPQTAPAQTNSSPVELTIPPAADTLPEAEEIVVPTSPASETLSNLLGVSELPIEPPVAVPAPVSPPLPSETFVKPTPAPQSPSSTETNTHVLASDDLVEIKVYRQPDLDTRARIDRDGTMTIPLLGTISIGGKTVEEARILVRDLLAREYLVNPQVSLMIVEYAKRTFTILGEVQRPGTYEIPGGQRFNLLQAIAFAGGYTRIGSPAKVTLQRMEEGRKKVIDLDAGRMAKDANVPPFEILPNDTINVGERFF